MSIFDTPKFDPLGPATQVGATNLNQMSKAIESRTIRAGFGTLSEQSSSGTTVSIKKTRQPPSGSVYTDNLDHFFIQFYEGSGGIWDPGSAYVICYRRGLYKALLTAVISGDRLSVGIDDTNDDWPPVGDLTASTVLIGGTSTLDAGAGKFLKCATATWHLSV